MNVAALSAGESFGKVESEGNIILALPHPNQVHSRPPILYLEAEAKATNIPVKEATPEPHLCLPLNPDCVCQGSMLCCSNKQAHISLPGVHPWSFEV